MPRDFKSIGAFIRHLEAMQAEVSAEITRSVTIAAKMIQREAWEAIGHYQLSAGPFPAWAELADSTRAQRRHLGFSEDEPLLRSGELRASIQYSVMGYAAVIGSNSDVAVWQEIGTRRIPPRSFLGASAFRLSPDIATMIGSRFAWIMAGLRPESR
jgi:phage gpG-like protein